MEPTSKKESINEFHEKIEQNVSRVVDKDGHSYSVLKGGDPLNKLWSEFFNLLEINPEALTGDKWHKTFSLLQSLEGKAIEEAQDVNALVDDEFSSQPKTIDKTQEGERIVAGTASDSFKHVSDSIFENITPSLGGAPLLRCFIKLYDTLTLQTALNAVMQKDNPEDIFEFGVLNEQMEKGELTQDISSALTTLNEMHKGKSDPEIANKINHCLENLASGISNEIKKLNLSLKTKKKLSDVLRTISKDIDAVEPKDLFLKKLSEELHLVTANALRDYALCRHYDSKVNNPSSTADLNDFIQNSHVDFSKDTPLLQKEGYHTPLNTVIEKFNQLVEKKFSETAQTGAESLSQEFDASLKTYLQLRYYLQDVSSKWPEDATSSPLSVEVLQGSLKKLEEYSSLSANPEVKNRWKLFNELLNTNPRLYYDSFSKIVQKKVPIDADLFVLLQKEIKDAKTDNEHLFLSSNSLDEFQKQIEHSDHEISPKGEPIVILNNGCKQSLTNVVSFFERCLETLQSKPESSSSLKTLLETLSKICYLNEKVIESHSQDLFKDHPKILGYATSLIHQHLTKLLQDTKDPADQSLFAFILKMPINLFTDWDFVEKLNDSLFSTDADTSTLERLVSTTAFEQEELYEYLENYCKNITDPAQIATLPSAWKKDLNGIKMAIVAKKANAAFMSVDLQKCFNEASKPDVLEISLKVFGEHYIVQTRDPSGRISKIFNEATEPLSKGGYKAGFLATDPETGDELFRLHPLAGGNPKEMIKEREMSKIFLNATIPGIPKVELVKTLNGKNPGELGLMMDFYQNGDLENYLNKHPGLPVQTRISLALDIATTMQGIHGKKYTHLDEKSKNVLVGYVNGQLKAYTIDFGFSKKLTKDATINPRYTGTSGYGTREMLTQEKEIPLSEDLDTWSVGITLLDLFESNLPKKDNYFKGYNSALQELYRTASEYTISGTQLPDSAGNQTLNLYFLFYKIKKSFPRHEWDNSFKELDALFGDYNFHLKNFDVAKENLDPEAMANEWEYLEKSDINIHEKLKDLLDQCATMQFISPDVLDSAWTEVTSKGADGKADPKKVEKGIQKIHLSSSLSTSAKTLQGYLEEFKKLNIITDDTYKDGIYTDPKTHRSFDLKNLDPSHYNGELEHVIKSVWERLIEKKRSSLEAESSPSSKSPDKDVKAFLSKLLELDLSKRLTLSDILQELKTLQESHEGLDTLQKESYVKQFEDISSITSLNDFIQKSIIVGGIPQLQKYDISPSDISKKYLDIITKTQLDTTKYTAALAGYIRFRYLLLEAKITQPDIEKNLQESLQKLEEYVKKAPDPRIGKSWSLFQTIQNTKREDFYRAYSKVLEKTPSNDADLLSLVSQEIEDL